MGEYELLMRLLGNSTGAFIAIVMVFFSIANFLLDRKLIRILEIIGFVALSAIYITWILNSSSPPIVPMGLASSVVFVLWMIVLAVASLWGFMYSQQKINRIPMGGSSVVVIINQSDMGEKMSRIPMPANVKVPGALWIIIIVIGISLGERYIDDPFIVELIFIAVGLALPLIFDNNAELKKAEKAIESISDRDIIVEEHVDIHTPGTRSSRLLMDSKEPMPLEMPAKPNPIISYLLG